VVAITGGQVLRADQNPDSTSLYQPVFDSTHSTWTVRFKTDTTPDGKSHQQKLDIVDAQQRAGEVTFSYIAGGLGSVTKIAVDGLHEGDAVTSDRTVVFSVAGTRSWAHTRLDLYLDCDPAKCSPTVTARDGALAWRLAAGPLEQGDHRVIARLTVTDDQGNSFGPEELRIAFTRSGTTWNIAAAILVGGIGLVAIGATFTASRRRGVAQARRRA
jgi:hypothetical protein